MLILFILGFFIATLPNLILRLMILSMVSTMSRLFLPPTLFFVDSEIEGIITVLTGLTVLKITLKPIKFKREVGKCWTMRTMWTRNENMTSEWGSASSLLVQCNSGWSLWSLWSPYFLPPLLYSI